MLQEGLDECAQWGDLDIQALLMVEGAELEAQRGKTDYSMAMLQVQKHTQTPLLIFVLLLLFLSNLVYFTTSTERKNKALEPVVMCFLVC